VAQVFFSNVFFFKTKKNYFKETQNSNLFLRQFANISDTVAARIRMPTFRETLARISRHLDENKEKKH
jgi:hypothetical protein